VASPCPSPSPATTRPSTGSGGLVCAPPRPIESFLPRLKGKVVRLALVNGTDIVGILEAWARYELLVETDDGMVVVQKGSIVTAREVRS